MRQGLVKILISLSQTSGAYQFKITLGKILWKSNLDAVGLV